MRRLLMYAFFIFFSHRVYASSSMVPSAALASTAPAAKVLTHYKIDPMLFNLLLNAKGPGLPPSERKRSTLGLFAKAGSVVYMGSTVIPVVAMLIVGGGLSWFVWKIGKRVLLAEQNIAETRRIVTATNKDLNKHREETRKGFAEQLKRFDHMLLILDRVDSDVSKALPMLEEVANISKETQNDLADVRQQVSNISNNQETLIKQNKKLEKKLSRNGDALITMKREQVIHTGWLQDIISDIKIVKGESERVKIVTEELKGGLSRVEENFDAYKEENRKQHEQTRDEVSAFRQESEERDLYTKKELEDIKKKIDEQKKEINAVAAGQQTLQLEFNRVRQENLEHQESTRIAILAQMEELEKRVTGDNQTTLDSLNLQLKATDAEIAKLRKIIKQEAQKGEKQFASVDAKLDKVLERLETPSFDPRKGGHSFKFDGQLDHGQLTYRYGQQL